MANFTREEIITDLIKLYNQDNNSIISLLYKYCIEKGKTIKQINLLKNSLSMLITLGLLESMLDTVCYYFETKFNIIKIYYNNQLIKIY